MKKWTSLFILGIALLAAIPGVYAQDIITLKNGDEIKAKVTEISSTEIKYKRFDNLDGPVVVIAKSDVFTIKYENGTKEVISAINTPTQQVAATNTVAVPRTQESAAPARSTVTSYTPEKPFSVGIYANPLGVLTFGPMVGAEFTFNRFIIEANLRFPQLGLLVPTAIDPDYDLTVNSGLGIGFGAKFYNAKPRGGFYVGGFVEYWFHDYTYDDYSSNYGNENGIVVAANIGYKFQFSNGLYLRTGGYLGTAITTTSDEYWGGSYNDYSGEVYIFAQLDLAIGFRF